MKVCIITSTRADFGLLKNLIFKIKKNKKFILKIIASGTHFSKKYGYTYDEIKESKIKIYRKIICKFNSDKPEGISQVITKCIIETSKIFKAFRPDLLIVLGDRYEILASTISAHLCRIPIAHIHGGEVTHGVIDDAFRHSITKMSHIHFVANTTYKKRVIQLGESPKNVYVVGGLGVDSISATNLLTKYELEKKFNFKFNATNFLVNFHPETLNKNLAKQQIKELLSALSQLKNTSLFFTMPGADLESQIVVKLIKKFTLKNKKAYFFKSLGQVNYFSFLKQVDGMIGNSSSGLLEMPYFKKGTINIGNRQSGRLISKSIINIKIKKSKIVQAVKKLLSNNFQKNIKNNINPYGNPGASDKIVKILEKIKIKKIINKKFFDINKI
jgi:GDP/UDP-N,N'-diacetylbacillosamine 2-epimerase (hydrolysing)